MKRSQRVARLVAVAEQAQSLAATELARTREAHDEREGRLRALLEYHDEYQDRLRTLGTSGANAATLKAFRGFMRQMDAGIDHARSMVEEARMQRAARQRAWAERRQRAQAYERLVERHVASEKRAAARAEQKASDDRGGRGALPDDGGR